MVTRPAAAVDVDVLRFLETHEARVHALPGREIRDLGDAVVLYDRDDREPFWNRVNAIRWPDAPSAFDRRLGETVALFATLDRIPHLWPRPILNEPGDLVARLRRFGFEEIGGGLTMVLADAAAAADAARVRLPRGVTVERVHAVRGYERTRASAAISLVLADSFEVEPGRRAAMELETKGMFDHRELHAVLVRVDGEPAAAAKRATFDGATYLSSIGTRPGFRGRGLGRLVTAVVTADAAATTNRWTYLGVFDDNHAAIRLYERLGFMRLGPAAPDLLLR